MNRIEIEYYKTNGYFLLRNFFKVEEVEEILGDAKSIFLKQFIYKGYCSKESSVKSISELAFNESLFHLFNDDLESFTNCGKQAQHLISLHSLALQERIIDLLHGLGLEMPTISTRPVIFFNHSKLAKKKVFHTVDAHQDWRSMQGSLNSVVLWLPLIDINKDLGALQILPGSHLGSLRTDHIDYGFGMVKLTEQENAQLISVEVNRGDALIFSSFLIHQSGENSTNRPRWSCHFRYNDLNEKYFIHRKFAHSYIYKPIEELITPDFPSIDLIKETFK